MYLPKTAAQEQSHARAQGMHSPLNNPAHFPQTQLEEESNGKVMILTSFYLFLAFPFVCAWCVWVCVLCYIAVAASELTMWMVSRCLLSAEIKVGTTVPGDFNTF